MPADDGRTGWTQAAEHATGKPCKQNTIHDMIGLLKRNYLWRVESGYSDINLKKISASRTPPVDKMTKTVESRVTAGDAGAAIRVWVSPGDHGLFTLLWPGGLWAIEVGTLT